jgi:hypothetical protein
MMSSASSCDHAPAIWAVRCQGIVAIHNRENASGQRNVGALETVGISASVPVLMMVANDRHHWKRKLDSRQDGCTHVRVLLHLLVFRCGQRTRFVEDMFGNRQLAQVVEESGGTERLHVHLRGAEGSRQPRAEQLNAADVSVRHLILGVDRHRERFDGRIIQAAKLVEMPTGVLEATRSVMR